MRGNSLDLLLLALAVVFAFVGYRRGFVLGTLSFVGFIVGALLGLQLAPVVVERVSDQMLRLFTAVTIALGVALIGQMAAFVLGVHLRQRIRSDSARVADGIGGGFVSVLAMLLVAWMLAAPLASAPEPWLASQVRHSALIYGVDRAVPDSVRNMYSAFSSAISAGQFPDIFHGIAPTSVPPIAAPDPELARSPVVGQARDSVVKVSGDAVACNRRSTGTGFVYAPQRVMTNAHVVAGTRNITVELYGRRYSASVVVFDPQRDVAVLRVPNLRAPVMQFNGEADAGMDAIVVGFPLNGPYTAVAARVRERDSIRGPDIYSQQTVHRDVYAIRSTVQPGNSGGPLLALDGSVYGVIFAAAVDDPETGFALTAQEVFPVAEAGRTAQSRVPTGDCQ